MSGSKGFTLYLQYTDPGTAGSAYIPLKHVADGDEASTLAGQYAARLRAGLLGVPGLDCAVTVLEGPAAARPPHVPGEDGRGWAVSLGGDVVSVHGTHASALDALVRGQLERPAPGWALCWENQFKGKPGKPFGVI